MVAEGIWQVKRIIPSTKRACVASGTSRPSWQCEIRPDSLSWSGGHGQLPPRGSHRSGRAQFGHPAPRVMVSLLRRTQFHYLAGSRRDDLPARCPRHLSPPQVPSSGRPLPIHRVLWGEFPDLTGTIRRLRLLASLRASLRLLRSALPPLRPSSLPRGATTPRGPGPLLPRRPHRLSSVEKTRPPRFLDDPCVHAPLSDPDAPPTPSHYSAGDGVFRAAYHVDSAMMLIAGLNHAACTLPVYASRPRSPQDAQHSVPAGGQPWPGRTLACGVAQKVSVMSIPLHACPRACPRASESRMPSSVGASSFTGLCLAHKGGNSSHRARRIERQGELLPARAVRRAAATSRNRPFARGRARRVVPRRAVLRPRPPDPARDAGRVPAPAEPSPEDVSCSSPTTSTKPSGSRTASRS